jgi:hypothetical protein
MSDRLKLAELGYHCYGDFQNAAVRGTGTGTHKGVGADTGLRMRRVPDVVTNVRSILI